MAIKPAERCDRTSPGTGWSPRGGFLSAATLSCSYLTGWAGLLYDLQPGVWHLGCSVVNSLWLAGIACCGDGMGRRRWMNACCLGHLHSVWRNSGLFIVELHNLIWAKFFLSLPAAQYRLSGALEAPAGSGQGCGLGSGDHSLPLSSISTNGAEYVGFKHSASFVLVFCQNQPSFLPPSLLQCKAAIEVEVSVELVPCPAPALTCHLNHSAYITFFSLHYSSLDFKLTKRVYREVNHLVGC